MSLPFTCLNRRASRVTVAMALATTTLPPRNLHIRSLLYLSNMSRKTFLGVQLFSRSSNNLDTRQSMEAPPCCASPSTRSQNKLIHSCFPPCFFCAFFVLLCAFSVLFPYFLCAPSKAVMLHFPDGNGSSISEVRGVYNIYIHYIIHELRILDCRFCSSKRASPLY